MDDSKNEYDFDDLSRNNSEEAVYALAASLRDVDRDDEWPDEAGFTEKIAAELAAEQPILEMPVPPPEPEPKNEAEKNRRELKKKLREEALERMENAARTLPEYNEVIRVWNHLDENRERRERSHELLRGDVPLEYGVKNTFDALIFPELSVVERQILRGYFLDLLADCPYEMHDLTTRKYIRDAVMNMKEPHKELLYFMGMYGFSPQRMARMRNQTDRNIRKVRDVMYGKLRKKLYRSLKAMMDRGYKPTKMEKRFILRYENGMEEPDENTI